MADLSAVLRKTIDGLPNATPELRARVYEKARAAILRQIENADPPLSDEDVAVRRNALEQAIHATEGHYASQEEAAQPPAPPPVFRPPPEETSQPQETRRPTSSPAALTPAPETDATPFAPAARPAWARRAEAPPPQPAPPRGAEDGGPRLPRADANFEPRLDERTAPPPSVAPEPRRAPAAEAPRQADRRGERFGVGGPTEPEAGFDIPDADTSAPRYSGGGRVRRARRSRKPLLLGTAAVILLAALGAAGYVYRSELEGMLGSATTTQTATKTGTAQPQNNAPGGGDRPPNGGVAGLPSTPGAGEGTSATPPPAGETDAAPAGSSPKRRFTQRLMQDGNETDEGPGPSNANAFDEGTNIAAATPEATPAPASPPVSPDPATAAPPAGQATSPPPVQAAPPASGETQPPNNAAPAVAQKAMFYEERTATAQGTQKTGNVVWSKVSETPAEGQPPEPAIRAVADVPGENFKMTMTIRRNLDPTLPASHVIELQFDVPPGFEGGQVANVQRLALKPSEEARGEPLIGVAGKISDGFFVIALNNLDKATETNLSLLGRQEWIDIPIAYTTGRRALMSIEKGVPGDRIFKETLDAWAAKT